MITLACDPGLANTGIVVFDGEHIVDARTITTKGNADTDPFAATVQRAFAIAHDFGLVLDAVSPDLVAIEAYEDFGGKHMRGVRRRWTTPMAIALIAHACEARGIVPRWQKASVVMTQYRGMVKAWERTPHPCLSNEHLRSAAVHGLYGIAHARFERSTRS